jgi:hypothetical protein
MPTLSARIRIEFGTATDSSYAARGTPEEIAAELRTFRDLGVEDAALWFIADSSDALVAAAERFAAEVAPLV